MALSPHTDDVRACDFLFSFHFVFLMASVYLGLSLDNTVLTGTTSSSAWLPCMTLRLTLYMPLIPQAQQQAASREDEILSSIEAVATSHHKQKGGSGGVGRTADAERLEDDAHQVNPAKKGVGGVGGLLSAFAPSTVGSLLGFSSKRRKDTGSARDYHTTRSDVGQGDEQRYVLHNFPFYTVVPFILSISYCESEAKSR